MKMIKFFLLIITTSSCSVTYRTKYDCDLVSQELDKALKSSHIRASEVALIPYHEVDLKECNGLFIVSLLHWKGNKDWIKRSYFPALKIGDQISFNLAYSYGKRNDFGLPDTVDEDWKAFERLAKDLFTTEELAKMETYYRYGFYTPLTGRYPG